MNTDELTKESRKKKLNEITKWSSGGNPVGLYTETQTDLTFPEVVEAAKLALDAVADSEEDTEIRTSAVYAAALARDMRYAAAGRRRIFELGVHNGLRETYEGGKIAIDAANG